MKNKKTARKGIFESKKFCLILSFVLAVVCWFVISLEVSPYTNRVISNVAVDFKLSSINTATELKAYTGEDKTVVNVNVSGKRYIVDSLTSESITVTPNLENVKGSGTYTLELIGKKNNNSDFVIESIEPATITVMLDTEMVKTLDVELNIQGATVEKSTSENESLVLENEFVNQEQSKVTITGPSKEVQKITKAEAYANVNKTITESEKVSTRIRLYNESGNIVFDPDDPINSTMKYSKLSFTDAMVMQNLYLQKSVPITNRVKNAPAVTPTTTIYEVVGDTAEKTREKIESIRIKGPQETIKGISSISLEGTVDYSLITPNDASSFIFKGKLPELADVIYSDYKNAKDLSFEIIVNSDGITSKSLNVPDSNITVLVGQNNVTAKLKSALKGITIVGPSDSVAAIEAEQIKATITVTETINGTYTKEVILSITGNNDCWFYGKYETSVEISSN